MRKVSYILFLSVYVLVTIGVTVAVHFCGGAATSVQMLPFPQKESTCGCDESTTPDDCCKTEVKSFQLSDEQIAVSVDQPITPQTDITVWAEPANDYLFTSTSIQTVLPASSPPDSLPQYILQCTLLI